MANTIDVAMHGKDEISLDRSRLILAFAITPLLPGFYGALLFAQPWALPIGAGIAYASAIVVGLPLIFAMQTTRQLQWWAFTLAGLICALPALLVYAWIVDVPHLQSFNAANAWALLGSGIFSGFMFWLLAIAGDEPVRLRDLFNPFLSAQPAISMRAEQSEHDEQTGGE